MNGRRIIRILVTGSLLAAAGIAPSFAARAIQGAVGEVSVADGAALGSVGFRIWSALPSGTTAVNQNTASCRGVRCIRGYITNVVLGSPSQPSGGGYVGNQEATQVYNGDLPDQPYYELVDADMNHGAGNHIGYYGVAGVTANNAGIGNFLARDCPPPTATNCFPRLDALFAGPPLTHTNASYPPGTHTIRAIGGLNPIPTVDVVVGGACPTGMGCLSWRSPETYAAAMRASTTSPAPPSPVLGVRVYRNFVQTCLDPLSTDPGWIPIGDFGMGNTSTQDPLPIEGTGCNFYALTVRLTGPGAASEIETFTIGAHSFGVGSTQTAVRIVRFDARYAGHGVVKVGWQSGIEGDIEGYRITRSTSAGGPYTVVSDLFRAQGDGSSYQGSDRVPAAGRSYYYQLQIVGRDGSVRTSSTAAATVPGRVKKAGPTVK